jgi:hypothetical protein
MLQRLWDLEVYEPLWPSPLHRSGSCGNGRSCPNRGMGRRLGSSHLCKLPGLGNGSKATTEIRNKENLHGGLIQAQLCEQTRGVDVER